MEDNHSSGAPLVIEGECFFEHMRPEGITPREMHDIFNDYESLSPSCAQAFLKATLSDLSFMSVMEFNRWTDLGLKVLRKSRKGEAVCLEFFRSGTVFLTKEHFCHMETWVKLALEIDSYSPETTLSFFHSTPVFLEQGKPFQLKQRAENAIRILTIGEDRSEAASAFLLSSSNMQGFMFSLLFKEWFSIGLLLSKASAASGAAFFQVDPLLLQDNYLPETKKILEIVGLISRISPEAGVEFYQKAPHALLKLNPNIREEAIKIALSISYKIEGVSATFDIIVKSLGRYANPTQETILGHAKAIERVSKRAAIEYFKTIEWLLKEFSELFLPFWVKEGLQILQENRDRGIRYFSLVSRRSIDEFSKWRATILFEDTKELLSILANAFCGEPVTLKTVEERSNEEVHGNGSRSEEEGRTFYLPAYISEGRTKKENFRLYKITTARQAGYLEFGTFDPPFQQIGELLKSFPLKEVAWDLFYIIEDGRIDHCLKKEYEGLAVEMAIGVKQLVEKRPFPLSEPVQAVMEILLRLTLDQMELEKIPDGLLHHYRFLKNAFQDFYEGAFSVWDSFLKTCEIYPYVARLQTESPYQVIKPLPLREKINPMKRPGNTPLSHPPDQIVDDRGEEACAENAPLPPEALETLLENLKNVTVQKRRDEEGSVSGISLSGLEDIITDGVLPPMEVQYKKNLAKRPLSKRAAPQEDGNRFRYDEWDYLQGEYRKKWCCLREKEIAPGDPSLYDQIFSRYAELINSVRRQFQQIRPALLETVRGVEQGDELYMPAVIQGVVDRKAGNTPSERIFIRKEKKVRRIATLLLIDMSASTGETVPVHPESGEPEKRIIDIEIESLVVMIEALNALDDDYAVYGFSGQGKEKVDFFRIKDFKEPASEIIKKRISGIEPRQSTRMGTAIRHAAGKLRAMESDHKLLILLSDGFPQDLDYGENRKSKEYALNDTMMAFIEAGKEGAKTFCITVDQAGNDYLRKMCHPGSYLVIQDIHTLPEVLPKVVESLII